MSHEKQDHKKQNQENPRHKKESFSVFPDYGLIIIKFECRDIQYLSF